MKNKHTGHEQRRMEDASQNAGYSSSDSEPGEKAYQTSKSTGPFIRYSANNSAQKYAPYVESADQRREDGSDSSSAIHISYSDTESEGEIDITQYEERNRLRKLQLMEETEESVERHTESVTFNPATQDSAITKPGAKPTKDSRNERHVRFAQQQSTQEDFYHETSESDNRSDKSAEESEESIRNIYRKYANKNYKSKYEKYLKEIVDTESEES